IHAESDVQMAKHSRPNKANFQIKERIAVSNRNVKPFTAFCTRAKVKLINIKSISMVAVKICVLLYLVVKL
ncbi:MAG: hypothetical protein IJ228_08430, partial [Succinivibrio sp.]|nr:hypothetical protein [Succinivibrio sp.]